MRMIESSGLRGGLLAGAVMTMAAFAAPQAEAATAGPGIAAVLAAEAQSHRQIEPARWFGRRCHWERRCWRGRWGRLHCRPIRVCRGRW